MLAILLDPDKINLNTIEKLSIKINTSPATYVFVGGSQVNSTVLNELLEKLTQFCNLPLILFPGNPSQISNNAQAILFLSLLSGRNPDFLIEYQVNAVPILKKTNLEIIPTGYILIESGTQTAVERVSKTKPLNRNNAHYILQTAQAGEMLGHKLIYLEAGSGAKQAVPTEVVQLVSHNIQVPLIVGGGIKSMQEIEAVFNAGANMVVIGTAFENNIDFFNSK